MLIYSSIEKILVSRPVLGKEWGTDGPSLAHTPPQGLQVPGPLVRGLEVKMAALSRAPAPLPPDPGSYR